MVDYLTPLASAGRSLIKDSYLRIYINMSWIEIDPKFFISSTINDTKMVDLSEEFKTLFPYKKARRVQIDGIENISDSIENNGIITVEGACGTGKTLMALVPYLNYIRNSSTDAEKVLAVTSVKQQMRAFQEEIKKINESLSSGVKPFSAITMVSVSDLHPYVKEGIIQENAYDQIDKLREGARELATNDMYDYDFDELYKKEINTEGSNKFPYGKNIPSAEGIEYDPYYAKYRSKYDRDEDNVEETLPFDPDYIGVMTADDLVDKCGSAGYCPHSLMRIALDNVDIVIGNYMHAFDPKTVNRISGSIIDEDTLAIFDEAHNLIPKVREFLSYNISLTSVNKSKKEIEEIYALLKLGQMDDQQAEMYIRSVTDNVESNLTNFDENIKRTIDKLPSNSATLGFGSDNTLKYANKIHKLSKNSPIETRDLKEMMDFLDNLQDIVSDQVEDNLPLKEDESIRLRDPKEPESDKISDWIKLNRFDKIAKKSNLIGEFCALSRDTISESSSSIKTSSNKIGKIIRDWYKKDNTRYYRSIEIENRKKSSTYSKYEWQSDIKAKLTIQNCIPRKEISSTLDNFKSSVLMSATLEPLDVYNKTTGIRDLEKNGREVVECTYGLDFPEKNRITLGIPSKKFKYSNRGSAFNSLGPITDNNTREQYKDIVFDVVKETNGSIMIVMPSYKEAEWIGTLLEKSFICSSDNIFIDKSSSNRETQKMKEKFFASEEGILITAARGTLIEGVDYTGNRLESAIVCGVPITNTESDYKKAIQAAYDRIFDDIDGFELAFTIPAVWKARQAIGRVIRTKDDIGIRIFADKRYVEKKEWDSVHEYMSPKEQEEMEYIPPKDLGIRISSFLENHN